MTRPAQFTIELDYEVGRTTLRLHGELDALSVPPFAAILVAISERGGFVTLDLSGLRSCNVGGLRAMAELAARLHARDGQVRIVEPGILTRMLDIVDLRSLFDLDEEPGSLRHLPRGA
jgi:anti-anti-sigma factor